MSWRALAVAIGEGLDAGELPDLALLRRRFTPATTAAPEVANILPPLAAYDRLIAIAGMQTGMEAAPRTPRTRSWPG
jgi:hypothetical protein